MQELYPQFTYSGIFFVALIGVSWLISKLEREPEQELPDYVPKDK